MRAKMTIILTGVLLLALFPTAPAVADDAEATASGTEISLEVGGRYAETVIAQLEPGGIYASQPRGRLASSAARFITHSREETNAAAE